MLDRLHPAMDDVFLVAVPFMAVAFVIALTMRERPLQGRASSAPAEASKTSETSETSESAEVSVAH